MAYNKIVFRAQRRFDGVRLQLEWGQSDVITKTTLVPLVYRRPIVHQAVKRPC